MTLYTSSAKQNVNAMSITRLRKKLWMRTTVCAQKRKSSQSTSVTEMEARIEADIEKAKADYKSAYEDGDADRIIDAQDRMLKASTPDIKAGGDEDTGGTGKLRGASANYTTAGQQGCRVGRPKQLV